MKRNLLLVIFVVVSVLILIYPLRYVLNQSVFNEKGGAGFDVGPDQAMIDIFVGSMIVPPLVAAFIFGFWGSGRWRWFLAIILSLPSVLLFQWAGIYLLIPVASFIAGVILSLITNYLIKKSKVGQASV